MVFVTACVCIRWWSFQIFCFSDRLPLGNKKMPYFVVSIVSHYMITMVDME